MPSPRCRADREKPGAGREGRRGHCGHLARARRHHFKLSVVALFSFSRIQYSVNSVSRIFCRELRMTDAKRQSVEDYSTASGVPGVRAGPGRGLEPAALRRRPSSGPGPQDSARRCPASESSSAPEFAGESPDWSTGRATAVTSVAVLGFSGSRCPSRQARFGERNTSERPMPPTADLLTWPRTSRFAAYLPTRVSFGLMS